MTCYPMEPKDGKFVKGYGFVFCQKYEQKYW